MVIVVIDFFRIRVNGIKEGFILLFGSFLRRHELTRLSGATYLLLGCMITALITSKPVFVAACTYAIVGDTIAAICGQTLKGPKIFKKTLYGSLGFLVSCVLVAVMLYFMIHQPLYLLLIGALAATVLEALPLPWDDNFAVPILTGVIMSLI